MMDWPVIQDYQHLFVQDRPLLDVRAPVEFKAGAFPNAYNRPLLNDQQRHLIGIEYKRAGQKSAIRLGEQLLAGPEQAQRQSEWSQFIQANPHGALYCFRGGLRSRIAQQWIYEATGQLYPRIAGGYKKMRQYLLTVLEQAAEQGRFLILGGRTGVGKTRALRQIKNSIDLEGLAHHRGSAFGHYLHPQPSQIDFENRLAVQYLKKMDHSIVLEDEGKHIGSVHLPPAWFKTMSNSPLIILQARWQDRVEHLFNEYIVQDLAEYQKIYGAKGKEYWAENKMKSLAKIRKRLGGLNYQKMERLFKNALQKKEAALYKAWIKKLMMEYYDPMYDYQMAKKKDRIIFYGDLNSVLNFLKT